MLVDVFKQGYTDWVFFRPDEKLFYYVRYFEATPLNGGEHYELKKIGFDDIADAEECLEEEFGLEYWYTYGSSDLFQEILTNSVTTEIYEEESLKEIENRIVDNFGVPSDKFICEEFCVDWVLDYYFDYIDKEESKKYEV